MLFASQWARSGGLTRDSWISKFSIVLCFTSKISCSFSVDKFKIEDADTNVIVYANGTVIWDQSIIAKVLERFKGGTSLNSKNMMSQGRTLEDKHRARRRKPLKSLFRQRTLPVFYKLHTVVSQQGCNFLHLSNLKSILFLRLLEKKTIVFCSKSLTING